MDKITILVVDDHPLLRGGLVLLLQKQEDFKVVGQAADGEEAVRLAKELSPDIVLLDIEMPKLDGLEATRQIKASNPETSVLVLTIHDDEEYVAALLEAGAVGYLLKTVCREELVQAIRAVHFGDFILDPQIGRRVLHAFSLRSNNKSAQPRGGEKLTTGEMEVIKLAARGMTNTEITTSMGISLRKVKGHMLEIFSKLGVDSRTEAVITCLRTGIISVEDL